MNANGMKLPVLLNIFILNLLSFLELHNDNVRLQYREVQVFLALSLKILSEET